VANLTAAPFSCFFRLADFFGFVGLMSEIFRIMSSNRDGWLYGFVFTLLDAFLSLFFPHQKKKVKTNNFQSESQRDLINQPGVARLAVRKNLDLVWVWFYKDVAPTALFKGANPAK
jgi:hypothetical protein